MRLTNPRTAGNWLAAAFLLYAAGTVQADPIQAYVALGDDLAFGSTTTTPQSSYGLQGYVQPFANFLAKQNNGVAPDVINLAVPGETSSTYFSADNSSDPARSAGAMANLNYGGDTSLAQRNILAGVIAAEHAAGRSITTVSFALGGADLSALVSSSAFTQASAAQQQSMVQQLLTTLHTNYTTALTQIRGSLPTAQIYLPSYYNPYAGSGQTGAVANAYAAFAAGQLQLVENLSSQFNTNTVNLVSVFNGNASQFTNVQSGNILPNAQGYAAISGQFIAVAEAPEPGTLSLLVFGTLGVAGRACLRRRAR